MNRRIRELMAVAAVFGLAATGCAEDPLSDFDGSPAAIAANLSDVTLSVGGTAAITASVLDGRSAPLALPVTFTGCDAAVSVAVDPTYQPVPATSARAIVTAVSAAPTCVAISGGGLTDTVSFTVLPTAFTGALSSTTPPGGSELTITSTALLKFDPAAVTVTFGGGVEGTVTSATVDEIRVLVPFSSPGPLSITGIDVTYVPGLTVTLSTTSTVTQTGDAWTGDDAFGTAPAVTLPTTAGSSTYFITNFAGNNSAICAEVVLNFGSTGPCVIYRLVIPAGGANLTVNTDWNSNADIDIYACSGVTAATCFEDGGAGATGAQPQEFTFTFPAGTHYLVIENYDGVTTTNLYTSIRRN